MWLISEDAAQELRRAERAGLMPSAERQREYEQRVAAEASREGLPRNMSIAGDIAEIRVEGPLTKKPSIWSLFFGGGGTTYRDIIGALSLAANDLTVKSAMLYVDSPGGQVDGLFDTLAAIEAFPKPLRVRSAQAQSAAFAIAAVAGKIEATGPAAQFGSIGTAIDFSFWSDIEELSITNSDSPDKRPDPRTPEGRAVIVEYLDAVNELFVDAIARGRGVAASAVTKGYGRGATLLAGEALRRGMIDSIAKPPPRARAARAEASAGESDATPPMVGSVAPQAEAAGAAKERPMDLKKLKAEHPDVYDQVLQEGVNAEHDRCKAHLTLGKQAGAEGMEIAVAAIESGEGFTLSTNARYMAVALNQRDRQTRQAETDASAGAVSGATPPASATGAGATEDMGDKVAAVMAARRGKKLNG